MNELALFAGAGGGILGGKLLGWRTVCAVEINPYARRVLLARQRDGILPRFPIWDDIRTFNAREWRGKVSVISGGFPCQRFSTATRGRATAEDAWPEMLRVVVESEPDFVFAENVSRRAVEIAGEDLRELGYTSRAIALSASDVGADHIRKRHWLFAYSNLRGELLKPLYAEVEQLPSICPGLWGSNPRESGVVNGLANRMDRFKAIGNGQVPAVVRAAWEALTIGG